MRAYAKQAAIMGSVVAVVTVLVAAAVIVLVVAGHSGPSAARLGRAGATRAGRADVIPDAARGAVSRVLGHADPAYRATAAPGGFGVSNARQGFVARVTRSGLWLHAGRASLHLSLLAAGDPRHLHSVPAATAPHAGGNTVAVRHGGITEWYVNGPLGLEQGFDVTRRLAPSGSALVLALAVSGSLKAFPVPGGLLFGSRRGGLRYGGVSATDARGRPLATQMRMRGGALLLRVDDRRARYPIRVDPLIEQAELRASDGPGAANIHLGSSIAVSPDTIAVGAPDAAGGAGAVYVFVRPASGWGNATAVAKLSASDGSGALGRSVAISGDTIVAGAPHSTIGGAGFRGAAYVFVKPASGWTSATETAKLTASDGAALDEFGQSVGIDGATIAVGAPSDNAGRGAAYVFVRPTPGWVSGTETAILGASDAKPNDALGDSVAASGNTIVANGGGAEYVFVEPPSGWAPENQTAKLTAAKPLGLVAIDGGTIAAGAGGAGADPGAAEVFVRPPTGWADATPTAQLTASDGAAGDELGASIDVSGDTIVAGALTATVGGNANQGAAYVFVRPASGWTNATQTAKLTAPDGRAGDEFGFASGVGGDTIGIGAPNSSTAGVHQGLAYVFGDGTTSPPPPPPATRQPSVTIESPADGAIYVQRQKVTARYRCAEGAGGPGLSACAGSVPDGGSIRTGVVGANAFSVTATSRDGLTTTVTHRYRIISSTGAVPGRPCLTGYEQKYPDFPVGGGVGPDYDLSDPEAQPTGVIEQTLAFGLSSLNRGMYVTTGGCWDLQRGVDGSSLSGFDTHQEFATFGEVNLNGVVLSPVNGQNSAAAPADLHVGTNGTIYATGNDTRYDVEVFAQDGSRLTVGRVDLGDTPWQWDGHYHSVVGEFGPSPNGPRPFHRPLVGGEVTVSGVGSASVVGYAQLPPLFSGSPDGAPPPTADLSYGPFTNPNVPSAPSGGGGGGSAGGGGLGAGRCNPTTHHCGENLAAADVGTPAANHLGTPAANHLGTPAANHLGTRAADASGQPLHLRIPDLYIGALHLTDAFLDYDPALDVWSGGGSVALGGFELRAAPPPPDNGLGLRGDGSFDHGGASLSVPGGVPLFPGVNLTELGAAFAVRPTRLSGDATVDVAGGLVTVHGGALVAFANDSHPYSYQPFALRGVERLQTDTRQNPITSTAIGVAGTVGLSLPVVGETHLAHGYVFYIAPSYFEFAGGFSLGSFGVSIDGNVSGALDTSGRRFSLAGEVKACTDFPAPLPGCIGLSGVVSSAGFGACGHITVIHDFAAGIRYEYSGGLTIFLDGCDLGPIIVDVRSGRAAPARAAAAAGTGLSLPSGLPSTSITVAGSGAAPLVALTGPHGEHATTQSTDRATDTGKIVIVPLRDQHETLIGIDHPAGGRWTITPESGSAPITTIEHANGLPPVHVRASVRARGHRYSLRYRIAPRAGQTVAFAERAGQVFHVLGAARGATGALTFTPASAGARRRDIVALISLSGVQRQQLVVGRYLAPGPVRAAAPPRLRVARRGSRVVVTWAAASGARGYAGTVSLSDGRRLSFSRPRGARSITIPVPVDWLGAAVRVMGIGADGNAGPARTTRLAPARAPAPVRGITAVRSRAGLVVRWRAARGAARYLVALVVGGAAGAHYVEVSGSARLRPSRDLAKLGRGTTVRITVRGMSRDGRLGPATVARYRAA